MEVIDLPERRGAEGRREEGRRVDDICITKYRKKSETSRRRLTLKRWRGETSV